MRNAFPYGSATVGLVSLCLGLTGCTQGGSGLPSFPPPPVSVSLPLLREVADAKQFTGRTLAVESVKVRARVWGHLQKINFREGAEVKKDDVLFEIDPRTYQAELDKAEANLVLSIAHRDRLQADAERARRLLAQRAISQEDYDKTLGDRAEADAAVKVAEATRASARLTLEYTRVRAPISGVVGRALVTVGNLIESGEMGGTTLTTLVSIDPMYVYFDVDDLTYLQLNQTVRDGPEKTAASLRPPVLMGLPNETGFPHVGAIDFIDNQVDSGTGTMKMRGVFPNKDLTLTSGLFVRVRIPIGGPHMALLVSDRAVDSDQGQKIVYVIGADNVAEKREIQVGQLYDGLREVKAGLKPGERIVVDGLQRVRAGREVNPRTVEMPVNPEAKNLSAPISAPKPAAVVGAAPKS